MLNNDTENKFLIVSFNDDVSSLIDFIVFEPPSMSFLFSIIYLDKDVNLDNEFLIFLIDMFSQDFDIENKFSIAIFNDDVNSLIDFIAFDPPSMSFWFLTISLGKDVNSDNEFLIFLILLSEIRLLNNDTENKFLIVSFNDDVNSLIDFIASDPPSMSFWFLTIYLDKDVNSDNEFLIFLILLSEIRLLNNDTENKFLIVSFNDDVNSLIDFIASDPPSMSFWFLIIYLDKDVNSDNEFLIFLILLSEIRLLNNDTENKFLIVSFNDDTNPSKDFAALFALSKFFSFFCNN